MKAQMNNASQPSGTLAYVRTLYAVEKELFDEKLAGDAVVSWRHTRTASLRFYFG